ncbi:MAG: DNA-processing protein DprA [Eggerthellaceae bacterium]|nr:DNA-processing protein DprA [Eggerthellaceae bacterium]
MKSGLLRGPRYVLWPHDDSFPVNLRMIPKPPKCLYVIGNPAALQPGLAVIGARKATPYGLTCARRFARIASEKGVCIISGGARGCDSEAHRAAINAGGPTVVFLGGGCDCLYPPEHFGLFQTVIDSGGAVVSERAWDFKPKPYTFRERNRLIAGLAEAVLIVEAGMPSGTFSTADEALSAGKDVLVVPGAITSPSSHGANRLLYDGALPVVDDDTFEDVLFNALGALKRPDAVGVAGEPNDSLVAAVLAAPSSADDLLALAVELYGQDDAWPRLMETLAEAEASRTIARQPDGKWGPVVRP